MSDLFYIVGMNTIDAIATVCLGEKAIVQIFDDKNLIVDIGEKISMVAIRVMARAYDRGTLKMDLPIAMERIKRRLSS